MHRLFWNNCINCIFAKWCSMPQVPGKDFWGISWMSDKSNKWYIVLPIPCVIRGVTALMLSTCVFVCIWYEQMFVGDWVFHSSYDSETSPARHVYFDLHQRWYKMFSSSLIHAPKKLVGDAVPGHDQMCRSQRQVSEATQVVIVRHPCMCLVINANTQQGRNPQPGS